MIKNEEYEGGSEDGAGGERKSFDCQVSKN